MKRVVVGILGALSLFAAGCVDQINVTKATQAVAQLGAAATLSDTEIKAMSKDMRAQGDAKANVASPNNKYAKRLAVITRAHTEEKGQPLNFKVYLTDDVNANATADGSIRVYSGLMDLMTDDELRYVLGHEIGHVIEGHSLAAARLAYTASAARKGAGALNSTADALTSSTLGDILEATINAQFSQKQELDADMYALEFMKTNHYNTQAAITALRKLEKLSSGGGGLLASHPAPGARAERIKKELSN